MSNKKILYIDLDGVMVNFESGIAKLDEITRLKYVGNLDEVPGIFALMIPMEGAIEAYHKLFEHYDVYFLSTAPWNNPSAWHDKLVWVKKYVGETANRRLILSHNKHLNHGDFLIDDRKANGADKFKGQHIHFGTPEFPGWVDVLQYLIPSK